MNAQPSFDPPEYPQPRRKSKSTATQQRSAPVTQAAAPQVSPRKRSRVKSNPAYAHRRQGMEVITKLVTYSALSVFGVITLVNSIGYNWAQRSKLQHLETELKDAQVRTAKVNSSFNRSFDPQLQKSVMQENSYKVAPDRRQIFIVNPTAAQATPQSSK